MRVESCVGKLATLQRVAVIVKLIVQLQVECIAECVTTFEASYLSKTYV